MEKNKIEFDEQQAEKPQTPPADQQPQNGKQKKIIVTGFGPFLGHEKVNASWEAVNLLPEVIQFKNVEYVLHKRMIPVEYAAVDKAIDEIWLQNPELVIHCGVHGLARCLHIEKLAYNHKFRRLDFAGKRLPNSSACLINCGDGIKNDVICCGLNVDNIVHAIESYCGCTPTITTDVAAINSNKPTIVEQKVAEASYDVGDYLCGYIYLKSLDRNSQRSLFVHVPPIDKPFSSAFTSELIHKIIEECIRQIVEDTTC